MGHGHVIKNKDGLVARCGGPAICSECALEYAAIKPDGNIHTMPRAILHIESEHCWCEPEIVNDFTSADGKKQYLHRQMQ